MAPAAPEPSGPFKNSDYEIGDHVEPASRRVSDAEATLAPVDEHEIEATNEKLSPDRDEITHAVDAANIKDMEALNKTEKDKDTQPAQPGESIAVGTSKESGRSFLTRLYYHTIQVAKNTLFMFTSYPYWDMAFWSGWSYSIGSALFVIDGFWSWQPAANPKSAFKGEEKYGVPLAFFFGAIFYQIGAVMAYFEAINDGSFAGSAMKRLLEGNPRAQKQLLDEKLAVFFRKFIPSGLRKEEDNELEKRASEVDPEAGWKARDRGERPGSVYPEGKHPGWRRGGIDLGPDEEANVAEYMEWRWWPTWHALKTRHLHELGYIACTIQLFGVTLYGITAVIVLPGIFDQLEANWQQLWGYWIPEIVAACCFLIASIMFMIETQGKWYVGEPRLISWWIGVWAAIGSVGFILIAALGIVALHHDWAEPLTGITTIWGSGAYMISALLQWYEVVNKGPVLAFPNRRHIQGTKRDDGRRMTMAYPVVFPISGTK